MQKNCVGMLKYCSMVEERNAEYAEKIEIMLDFYLFL